MHCLDSSESKLIAVYGRRRVGKTFLIRNFFRDKFAFEITALHNGDMKDQLVHFANTVSRYYKKEVKEPESWMDAFEMLASYIGSRRSKKKKVIFIDELPWFDTPRSKFLTAFEHFWNSYCTKRNDIVLVICGSAASWMIKKIIKNKGGLHNRVSERIRLLPFTLYETESFLKAKHIKWSRYDIAQLYMVTGGVPYYLDGVRKGESIAQFIDRSCFKKDGFLTDEYDVLFSSLFDNSRRHYKIVEALSEKKKGLNRSELIAKTGLASGGTLTNTLDELIESGFVEAFIPYQANKTKAWYKLIDHFTLFYLKFMQKSSKQKQWDRLDTRSWNSWSGLAFERICFTHVPEIKQALRIENIASEVTAWEVKSEGAGAQIDLLIDRADRIVNLCEIKFAKGDFLITKDYAMKLRNKEYQFGLQPKNKKKTTFLTMVTTFGVVENQYATELVQNVITLDDLFASTNR